jgi:hypothetical protein
VASERGRAQTVEVFLGGVVGPLTWESGELAECSGKFNHRG